VAFDTRNIWQNQDLSTLFREAEALMAAPRHGAVPPTAAALRNIRRVLLQYRTEAA
jgi:hypothetical protein